MLVWDTFPASPESAAWLVPLLLGCATLAIVRFIPIRSTSGWLSVAVLLGGATLLLLQRFAASRYDAITLTARSCAVLSVVGAMADLAATRAHRHDGNQTAYPLTRHISRLRTATLILGSIAFTILLVILVLRVIYVVVDLANALPVRSIHDFGFSGDGLGSLACLFAACLLTFISTRATQLPTCLLLIAVMFAAWGSLLGPVFVFIPKGGLRATGATSTMAICLSLVLACSTAILSWSDRRRRRRATGTESQALPGAPEIQHGFRISFVLVAVTVLLMVCYHLAVPIDLRDGSYRTVAMLSSASAALAAGACFSLLSKSWSYSLADVGVALMSTTICCLAVSAIPHYPESLAERYPVVFNAMIVGLALASALCTKLALVWDRQVGDGNVRPTAGRLISHVKRGAFMSAVSAVALGGLMAIWPLLPAIAVADASMGRITAGFGADLFLLLVVLWSARRLRRMTFHVLVLLAVASAAGFMIMRMLPYTPRFS